MKTVFFDFFKNLFGTNTEIVPIEEQYDPLNRLVKLFRIGDTHSVSVDDTAIECGSYEAAKEEYEFRIQNSNRLI